MGERENIMFHKGISTMKWSKNNQVIYEILMGSHVTDCLSCDLVEVANLVSIHVVSDSVPALKKKTTRNDRSKIDENHAIQCSEHVAGDGSGGLKDGKRCHMEKVAFRSISCIRREIPEPDLGWPLRRKISQATNKSAVEGVVNKPVLSSHIDSDSSKTISVSEETDLPDQEVCSSSSSSLLTLQRSLIPGWPLLQKTSSATLNCLRVSEAREIPVVQWVMSLPNRSTPVTQQAHIGLLLGNSADRETTFPRDKTDCLTGPQKQLGELELFLELYKSGCKRFRYKELKRATSQFSAEALIGEGGCSNVYKGCLSNGKLVAVKVLKSYKEAWNDFVLEVAIISSLNHKNITPLLGVCKEGSHLILVYDFLPKGSLETSLQGQGGKSVLPWKVRFNVAVAVAEALNYLHNECPQRVIHRDVKSSNILLSNELQPQLSDFGLALWAPRDSSYMIESDVVGTFGYMAPEYFMHGRVSEKIDVYSFGVVLLELLSGRRAIISKALKGQESLVKWAKPLLESADVKALLDPRLGGEFDSVEMHRMVLAATLCLSQSTRFRPKVSQILKLLREDNDKGWVNSHVCESNESSDQEDDDDSFPEFGCEPHLVFSFLDADDDASSLSSAEKTHHFMLKDYLKHQGCSS